MDRHRLMEPRYNTEVGLRVFMFSDPRLYNRLPQNVKKQRKY